MECGFKNDGLVLLKQFMSKHEANCRDPNLATCSVPIEGDSCLEACKTTEQYGNGFSFLDIMNHLNSTTSSTYTSCFPSRVYGAGCSGIVIRVSCSNDGETFTHYAMKLSKFKSNNNNTPPDFLNEVTMQKKFHRLGVAPNIFFDMIYKRENCDNALGVIVMEPIGETYADIIRDTNIVLKNKHSNSKMIQNTESMRKDIAQKINMIVQTMKTLSLTHGDMHTQNIAFIKGRIVLIDFGRSTDFYPNTVLDLSAVSYRDVFMVPYLTKEISLTNIPGRANIFDDNFERLLTGDIKCNSNRTFKKIGTNMDPGEAIRYKLLMSHGESHRMLLKKLYKM